MSETSFDTAVSALYSEVHQSRTASAIQAAAARRKQTVVDMRTYLDRVQVVTLPKHIRLVHITGTKGKGSTASLCEGILRNVYGQRTGLFTSPHLVTIRERIRINGMPVSREAFGKAYWEIRRRLEAAAEKDPLNSLPVLPGYFRMLTLMAVFIFARYEPDLDVIILEVGMGGRYDATNIFDLKDRSYACGVTKLDLDHTRVLGNTLEKIAWEKGGIFLFDKTTESNETTGSEKDKGTVFALDPTNESVEKVLRDCAQGHSLQLIGGPHYQRRIPSSWPIGLAGKHQRENAEMALALCEYVMKKPATPTDSLHQALANVSWPGRCQTVTLPDRNMTLRLDGAHTVESLSAGLTWYSEMTSMDARRTLLFNCSHERDPVELLELLLPLGFDSVYFCRADSERPSAVSKKTPGDYLKDRKVPYSSSSNGDDEGKNWTWQETLCSIWKHLQSENNVPDTATETKANLRVAEALEKVSEGDYAGEQEVLVTGSLYLVGSALTAIGWDEGEAQGRLSVIE